MLDTAANLHVPVARPLRLENPENYAWDQTVDVAVVGLGAAGACAALEAAEGGAQVLVLDRLNGGGASALSGGVMYAGGGSRQQREAGVEDSPDNLLEYLRVQAGGVVAEQTLRRFCDDSIVNLEWLEQHGVRFASKFYREKNSFPGGEWGLYYSGNEAYAPYNERATAAARGHIVQGSGYATGHALMKPLIASLRQRFGQRVQIRCHAEVFQLIVDTQNNVIGLRYRVGPQSGFAHAARAFIHRCANAVGAGIPSIGNRIRKLAEVFSRFDREQSVRVRNGAILSAGGFVFNRAMLQQATGGKIYSPRPLGEECNGSGIRLGISLNGATERMERLTYWRFYAPPHGLLKSIAVGGNGVRQCNEALYGATVADVLIEKSAGKGWLIVDEKIMQQVRGELRGSMHRFQKIMGWQYLLACTSKANSIELLAQKLQLPAAQLRKTIDAYNQRIAAQQADEFNKPDAYRQIVDQGPFYAIDITIGAKGFPCPSLTLGGLRVDERNGHVLNNDGEPIGGLYAAGRNAVGICSYTYISGLSLADCVFSGRRAGRNAAQR
ncbi:MAG TPA: FAD-binding protein [Spongiibacteraceae bacterium]|nr:FAD-binding protein [Spongiibacteraceae bacterium]